MSSYDECNGYSLICDTDLTVLEYMEKGGVEKLKKTIKKIEVLLKELNEAPYIVVCEIKESITFLERCIRIIENYNIKLEDLQERANNKGITLVETPDYIELCFKRTPSSSKQFDLDEFGFWGEKHNWKIANTPSAIYRIDMFLEYISY